MEDIKQNITDNQYKTIMDALKEIYNLKDFESHSSFKYISLINWLDSKIEITNDERKEIKKIDLHKYIIINFYDDRYYDNIDFVIKALEVYFTDKPKNNKFATSSKYYQFVKFK